MVTFLAPAESKRDFYTNRAGSIGHVFTARVSTGDPGQASFYPFILREVSVRSELTLGHLCYCLTDVPPQPNSPTENVFGPSAFQDEMRMLEIIMRNMTMHALPNKRDEVVDGGISRSTRESPAYSTLGDSFHKFQTRVKLNRVFFPR